MIAPRSERSPGTGQPCPGHASEISKRLPAWQAPFPNGAISRRERRDHSGERSVRQAERPERSAGLIVGRRLTFRAHQAAQQHEQRAGHGRVERFGPQHLVARRAETATGTIARHDDGTTIRSFSCFHDANGCFGAGSIWGCWPAMPSGTPRRMYRLHIKQFASRLSVPTPFWKSRGERGKSVLLRAPCSKAFLPIARPTSCACRRMNHPHAP
ncbi:hypothetical protein EKPJFOCH_0009 [Methylobacterium thuringiense]|uniref:Uncharacterized protein n=1 Tax=Methylobacterium thuringiense TaxID=1003091 RepID=A0ABQ4TDU6_9HYPH|nr:hypothetical protein EKPJFOCH_0009 [Methylobacterium thuringiense]